MSARHTLLELFDAALRAVDGRACVARFLRTAGIQGPVEVFAIGKAASSMALGARDALGDAIRRMLVITKDGHSDPSLPAPGVLQLEGIAQAAGILMLKQFESLGKLAYFMSAESVKWRNPVRPGDTLVIDVELTKTRGKIGKARGVCSVNGTIVSEAEVTFMVG